MNSKSSRLSPGRLLGGPRLVLCAFAALHAFYLPPAASSAARQQESAVSLGVRSSIVVRGSVAGINASIDPQLAPAANTIVVKVTRMYSGSEIAGDQTGRSITVILSRPPRFRVGDEGVFFGNPRFVGKSLTMADEGELPASDPRAAGQEIERAVRARKGLPVRMRLAVADMVFRGRVEEVRPLEAGGAASRGREPASEHDPEWQVASVRVVSPLRGVKEGTVLIIFPASRDIMWFNTPKPQRGQEAVFIAHRPLKEEGPLLRATGVADFLKRQPAAEIVTHPYDVLPAAEEGRVRELLTKEER